MHLPDSHETRAQRLHTKITTFYLSTPPVFLSSFLNVKLLRIDVVVAHKEPSDLQLPSKSDALLPDEDFRCLSSLSLNTMMSGSGAICSDNFIRKQSSLLELDFEVGPRDHFLWTSSTLKFLGINSAVADFPIMPSGHQFISLSTLRVHRRYEITSPRWITFLNDLPRLRCIEVNVPGIFSLDILASQELLPVIRKGIIEFGLIIDVSDKDGLQEYYRNVCVSTKFLVSRFYRKGTAKIVFIDLFALQGHFYCP